MNKIKMKPIVEMDGDEMTRIIWSLIKQELLCPFVDLNTEYYDLGLENRDKTDDSVTLAAALAIKAHRIGVKCATITPNAQRVEEYGLKQMWKSPNATIRAELDGTVFRTPIMCGRISPCVKNWKAPITVARHAFGDIYKATEQRILRPGRAELLFTADGGESESATICDFEGPGVLQGIFNTDVSIEAFARSSFEYALFIRQDLWFCTKDTISKQYDQTFKLIFQRIFDAEYKSKFEAAKIEYFYTLIDDAVSRVMRSRGGFLWALKNYDGDVMSDMISSAFGSLAMMTSVLVSPDSNFEFEAAHGTVTRHYYRHLKGEATSTNPVATIFAWSGALAKRGELDGNFALSNFAKKLEAACLEALEEGIMTGDLSTIDEGEGGRCVSTGEFILAVRQRLEAALFS